MGADKFISKELDKDQLNRVNTIKRDFSDFYNLINHLIPEGREKSLYITKMEEACMWAVKAISKESDIDA